MPIRFNAGRTRSSFAFRAFFRKGKGLPLSLRVSLISSAVAFLTIAPVSTGSAKVEDIGLVSTVTLGGGPDRVSNLTRQPDNFNSDENRAYTFNVDQSPAAVIDFRHLDPIITEYSINNSNADEAIDSSDQRFLAEFFNWSAYVELPAQTSFSEQRAQTKRRASCALEATSIEIIRCEARDGLFLPSWVGLQEASKDGYSAEPENLASSGDDGATATQGIAIGLTRSSYAYHEIVFSRDSGVSPMLEPDRNADSFPGSDYTDPVSGSILGNGPAGPRAAGTIPETPLPTMLLIGAGSIALTRWKTRLRGMKAPPTAFLAGLCSRRLSGIAPARTPNAP